MDLQFFGGGGSSTEQVRKRDPEPEELKNLRGNIYGMLNPLMGGEQTDAWKSSDFGKTWTDNQRRTKEAYDMYDSTGRRMPGLQDAASAAAGRLDGAASEAGGLYDEILGFTKSGQLPAELAKNMNASINGELARNTGSTLSGLASRGVLNSSVTNRSMNELSRSAAEGYAKNYTNAYNSVLGGYDTARGAMDSRTEALKSALSGHQSVLQSNAALMDSYAARPKQLTDAAMAQFSPAYDFWRDWQSSYDGREDYDTVVHQGK